MSIHKKILVAAIVGGLFSTSAIAGHRTLNFDGSTSITVADELVFPATIDFTGNSTDFLYSPNYNFGNDEERYVGIKCTGATINAPGTPGFGDTDGSGSTATFGAVNGGGTSSVFYTIRSGNSTTIPDGRITAPDTIYQEFDSLTLTSGSATCTAALYSNPTDASAPGTTAGAISGTVKTTSIDVETGINVTIAGTGTVTANVESTPPAYSQFFAETAYGADTLTRSISAVFVAEAAGDQLDYDGEDITLQDMQSAFTSWVVTGDMSWASGIGVYENANCTGVISFGTFNGAKTVATIPVDEFNGTGGDTDYICLTADGTTAIPASDSANKLSVMYDANPEAGYDTKDVGPVDAAAIVRNGTELQATLAQQPTGWMSRIAVANDSTLSRAYTVRVLTESGQTAPGGTRSGVLSPGLTMIDLSSMVSGFSGAPRATVILNVAAPNGQIQAMYQLVEPTKGAINNAQMVRPGTN